MGSDNTKIAKPEKYPIRPELADVYAEHAERSYRETDSCEGECAELYEAAIKCRPKDVQLRWRCVRRHSRSCRNGFKAICALIDSGYRGLDAYLEHARRAWYAGHYWGERESALQVIWASEAASETGREAAELLEEAEDRLLRNKDTTRKTLKARKVEPIICAGYAHLYAKRGAVLMHRRKKLGEALLFFDAAVASKPGEVEFRLGRVDARTRPAFYWSPGERAAALAELDAIVSTFGPSDKATLLRARIALMNENYEAAAALYRGLSQHSSLDCGDAEERREGFAECAAVFQKAKASNARQADLQRDIARLAGKS